MSREPPDAPSALQPRDATRRARYEMSMIRRARRRMRDDVDVERERLRAGEVYASLSDERDIADIYAPGARASLRERLG